MINPLEKVAFLESLESLVKPLPEKDASQLFGWIYEVLKFYPEDHNCGFCENFDTTKKICKLCDEKPPEEIVKTGCPEWSLTRVPF